MSINGAMRGLTIGGRGFKVAHDGPGNKDLGGRNNELAMNGDGSFRTLQSVMPGSLNDLQIEIDNSRGDQEYLKGIADAGLPVNVVATYASNTSYAGDLVLVGEMKADEATGLVSLGFQGSELTKI